MTAAVRCERCRRVFVPRFRFQAVSRDGSTVHYCSQTCREPGLAGSEVSCSCCGRAFRPSLAAQVCETSAGTQYFCSPACRREGTPAVEHAASTQIPAGPCVAEGGAAEGFNVVSLPERTASVTFATGASDLADDRREGPRAIAVLNQKGGTGKTTTALCVAAGLARVGEPTLLVDLDPQGNVGISLGINGPRTVYHMVVRGAPPDVCAVPVRDNLDVITANEGLVAAEIALARADERTRTQALARVMRKLRGYRYVVFDCAPALSMLNNNALYYSGEVLIPVSCDYLALVGVKQVLRTLRRVSEQTARPVRVCGVLPTFYDVRNKLCLEALEYLRKTFGPRALPPVRVNTRLAEAPSLKKTIFEHAPESHGARDYVRVVEWIRTGQRTYTETKAA